jgi:hypothetical protein
LDASLSKPWCTAITFGAAPKVEIGAVRAIDMAALILFTLQRPDALIVIVAFELRLFQQPLRIAIKVTFVDHRPPLGSRAV